MTTWALTLTGRRGLRTLLGSGSHPHTAHAEALRALSTLTATHDFDWPHIELTVAGQLAAIIGTGRTHGGLPDHLGLQRLVARLADASDTAPR